MAIDLSSQVVSVADAVANELRTRLLAGRYPGDTTVRDTALSQEFNVARPTARAAVQLLVAEGLLVRGRGRSARVRSFSEKDAVDIYRVRTLIELSAIDTVIAERVDLTGIAAALGRYTDLADGVSWDQVADADVEFHRAAVAASGSPRLLRTFNEISVESRLLIAQLRPVYRGAKQLAEEHRDLLEVLRAGKIRPAREAWRAHLVEGQASSLEMIETRNRRMNAITA